MQQKIKENLAKKRRLCTILVLEKKKRITNSDVDTVANSLDLDKYQARRAWKNFVETGGKHVDLRTVEAKEPSTFKAVPTIKCTVTAKNKNVNTEKAGAIIKEYMASKVTSRELCNKYNVSLNQFYEWIHELNVAGTLLDRRVLDVKKYAKQDVLDAIWLLKYPNTSRKSISSLSHGERLALERLGDVLEAYL